MWIFGFVWGVVNLCMVFTLLYCAFYNSGRGIGKFLWFMFLIFVAIPAAILFTIMPFFGPWIVAAIVQRVSHSHSHASTFPNRYVHSKYGCMDATATL